MSITTGKKAPLSMQQGPRSSYHAYSVNVRGEILQLKLRNDGYMHVTDTKLWEEFYFNCFAFKAYIV